MSAHLLKPLARLRKEIEIYGFMAMPAVGKSSLVKVTAALGSKYGVARITSSDMIRDNIERGTELGKKFMPYVADMAVRKLIPDDLILSGLIDKIIGCYESGGSKFLLDGIPRTTLQAEELLSCHVPFTGFEVTLPKEEILRRDAERLLHEMRIDDGQINEGISVFEKETTPAIKLCKHRGRHHEIDGRRTIADKACTVLKRMGFPKHERKEMLTLLNQPDHPARLLIDKIEGRERATHNSTHQQSATVPAWKKKPWWQVVQQQVQSATEA